MVFKNFLEIPPIKSEVDLPKIVLKKYDSRLDGPGFMPLKQIVGKSTIIESSDKFSIHFFQIGRKNILKIHNCRLDSPSVVDDKVLSESPIKFFLNNLRL